MHNHCDSGNMVLELHISYGTIILSSIIGILLGFVLELVFFSVDYSRTERVQFEDDEYYYYVKAVPKVVVATPEKTVKHITEHTQEKKIKMWESRRNRKRWEEVKRRTDDLLLTQSLSRELGLDNDQIRDSRNEPVTGRKVRRCNFYVSWN